MTKPYVTAAETPSTSFWDREEVRQGLLRLSRALKTAGASDLADSGVRSIRQLAELARVLERRQHCRVPPQLYVMGSAGWTHRWSLYLECAADAVKVLMFNEERLPPDGDVMICDERSAEWDASASSLPSVEALSAVCEVLESVSAWRFSYSKRRPSAW